MPLLRQSGSTAAMPVVASLAEQESRRLSFLPLALIFVPVHVWARAVLAPRVMVARTPSAAAAANSFIFVPFIEPSGRGAGVHNCGLDVIVKEKSGPLGLPGASARPRSGPSGGIRGELPTCTSLGERSCKLASSGAGGRGPQHCFPLTPKSHG